MKPSAVFFIAVDLLRSLGKRFPSSTSFSPASGMWAATYTNPATDGSVSGCFVPWLCLWALLSVPCGFPFDPLQIEYNLLLQSYGNGMVQSKSDRFAPSPALRLKNLRVPA